MEIILKNPKKVGYSGLRQGLGFGFGVLSLEESRAQHVCVL